MWEKKAQTYNHGLEENSPEKLNFINLDRYPICRAAVEPQAGTALQVSIDASCQVLMNITFHLNLGQTCMALTLELETLFLEVLNTS